MNILNLKILASSTPRSLRAISILTFLPAFIVLLIQGIISKRVNPAIGILPLFFSSTYSLLLLANERKCGCKAGGLTGTPLHMMCDLLCGVGLLMSLVLTWVFLPQGYYMDNGLVMLGTYGTNFLIVNFLIHLYFIVQQVIDASKPGPSSPSACPQCQYMGFPSISVNWGEGPRAGYAPLLDRKGMSMTSEEEETRDESGEMV